MRIKIDLNELKKLARSMNPDPVDFSLKSHDVAFEPIDDQLGGEGIEIDLDAIDKDFNLLSYHGRQVLLYIKDHTGKLDATLADPVRGNRFHIAHCKTLEDMRARDRFQRYVATNNVSGSFLIVDTNIWGRDNSANAKLMVCMNCLTKLNYLGSVDYGSRQSAFKEFSLTEFFSRYSSCFRYMPKAWADTAQVGYTEDWKDISAAVREAAKYICAECKIDLTNHRRLCHVHHINGVRSDNAPDNLQVLCKDCHRRKPFHGGIFVSHAEMAVITGLRRKFHVLESASGWDEVMELSDPAVHGDLMILRRNGFPKPPVVGYEVQDSRHEVIGELEVAWPERKVGITIRELLAPGWKIYRVGEVCSL